MRNPEFSDDMVLAQALKDKLGVVHILNKEKQFWYRLEVLLNY